MTQSRRLSLKSEALTALTTDELMVVNGAAAEMPTPKCPSDACPTNGNDFCSFFCQFTANTCLG